MQTQCLDCRPLFCSENCWPFSQRACGGTRSLELASLCGVSLLTGEKQGIWAVFPLRVLSWVPGTPSFYGYLAPMCRNKTGKFFWKSSEFIPQRAKSLCSFRQKSGFRRDSNRAENADLRSYLTDAPDLLWVWLWKRIVSAMTVPLARLFNTLLSFENPLPA